jgi:hypothetical protein
MTQDTIPSPKTVYEFRLILPVNGKLKETTVEVWNGENFVTSDTADMKSAKAREQLAKRLADRLGDDAAAVGKDLEQAWSAQYPKALAQQRANQASAAAAGSQPTAAERLLALAKDAAYFNAPDGRAYATVNPSGHDKDPRRATVAVRGHDFRGWLARRYFLATSKPPNAEALQEALGVCEAVALYDRPCRPVHVRVAGTAEKFWIDLGGPCYRAVEIDAAGWRLVHDPPVRFRRPRGLLPLPEPQPSGGMTLDDLQACLNVPKEGWPLVVACAAQAAWPAGPYPVLLFYGEQGSAKSTAAKRIRDLIDPSAARLRSGPRDERDLVIWARNSWVMVLDNVSKVPDWLSDALCRLACGGGFATRELYTDAEEMIFDAARPVIITTIDWLPDRHDLVDRSVMQEMPPIGADRRKTERELDAEWRAEHPYLLGAFLDLLSATARELPGVRMPRLPRMADFGQLGTAVERAMGWADQTFADCYRDNINAASSAALEASVLAGPLRSLLQAAAGGCWEGPCEALLSQLAAHLEDPARPPRGWPKLGNGLSGQLRRLAPALRGVGIHLEMSRTDSERTVRLQQQQPQAGQ